METEKNEQVTPEEETEKPVYTPRPKWQVIGAWIALFLFLLMIAGFYINVSRGGL